MRVVGVCLFLWLAASTSAQTAMAQEPAAPNPPATQPSSKPRPKIGIALEGGGALGLAHIGVLQWFEEHHIPVDYIAGTSMGGLVAGLYATGQSPEQLEKLIKTLDWDFIVGGQGRYQDLAFRRKEDLAAYPNSIRLGLKHGVSPPSGLNPGQQISFLIDRETLPYSAVESFDDLPIPFRCVATDLVSGKQVVFSKGKLSLAMRATMSIPGIFSPVRDGDKVYVDGGLVGNLPTDVVRAMGADIVIGVHLETAPAKAEDIKSIFSVLGRSVDVVIRDNELRGLAGSDLVVKVDLQNFNSMDYEKNQAIIRRGKEAAADKEAVLLPFALDDAAWQEYVRRRDARKQSSVPVPQFVKVEGVGPGVKKSVESTLQPLVGKKVDTRATEDLLSHLTGNERFSSLDYRLVHGGDLDGLEITAHENVCCPPTLQLGFEVDGSETQDVTFTQAGRLTFVDVAGFRSEWRTDFLFGATYGLQSELYKPLGALSNWFVAPRAAASDSSFRIYNHDDPTAEYRFRRASIGADLGYSLSRFTEFRVGYEVGHLSAQLRLGTPEFSSNGGRFGDVRLRLVSDHTDDPVVPRRGYSWESNFRAFDTYPGATESLPALQATASYFQPITKPASVFVSAEGASSFGVGSGIPLYFLGGPSRLGAYGLNELFGNQYYLFRAGYLHDLFTLPPFVGKKVFAIGTYEFAKMYGFSNATKFPTDLSGGLLAETAFGPLFVGGSVGDSGHRKVFFQLGKVF
jgi:NTE family protein